MEPLQDSRIGSPPAAGEQAPQGEPALLGQLPLGDGDEHAQAGLGRQQIVVARVAPPLVHVVADAQQTRRLVVEEAVFHVGEFAGLQGQALDGRDAGLGTLAALLELLTARSASQLLPAGRPVHRRLGGEAGRRHNGETRQGAQGRDGIDLREVVEPFGRLRLPGPRREKRQLVAQGPALPGQRPCPPDGLGLGLVRPGRRRRFGDRASRSSSEPRRRSVAGGAVARGLELLPESRQRGRYAGRPRPPPGSPGCRPGRPASGGSRIGRSSSASRPGRRVSRWPARLPLSTVET